MNAEQTPIPIPVHFMPESWGAFEFFKHFYCTTHKFDWQVRKRLPGIQGNFLKAQKLIQVVEQLIPHIAEDEREIASNGYSSANRSHEIAAVAEAAFCSLYSSLDCFRHVFMSIYRKNMRGIKESTRTLFEKGGKGELDQQIPVSIRDQFLQATSWFPTLREYRDEIIHSDVGHCHRDNVSGKVMYMHAGLGSPQRALVIEDVVAKLVEFRDTINAFLGCVFKEINQELVDLETDQICGVFNGRFYQRSVKPSEAVDFHGGRCKSHEWFDKSENPACPLKDRCDAYTRVKSEKPKTDAKANAIKKLTWEEIRRLTPMLFFRDEKVAPPNFVRRLWAAISSCKLNEYETDVERSDALSVLMTLAMIFQEFRSLVFHQSLLKPQSMVNYLGIPEEHIKQILNDNMVTTETSGASIEDILTLDSMNRDCVYDAIVDYFPRRGRESPDCLDRDGVFRLFAFPVGLSREEMKMPVSELIEKKVFEAGLDGTLRMAGNFEWQRGFEFIDSRFARTIEYT